MFTNLWLLTSLCRFEAICFSRLQASIRAIHFCYCVYLLSASSRMGVSSVKFKKFDAKLGCRHAISSRAWVSDVFWPVSERSEDFCGRQDWGKSFVPFKALGEESQDMLTSKCQTVEDQSFLQACIFWKTTIIEIILQRKANLEKPNYELTGNRPCQFNYVLSELACLPRSHRQTPVW